MKTKLHLLFALCVTPGLINLVSGEPKSIIIKAIAPVDSAAKTTTKGNAGDVDVWLTTANRLEAFSKQDAALKFNSSAPKGTVINITPATTYQTIDGFGFCLTGASANVINAMEEPKKNALINDLFATDQNHIGISYLRLSIGASDLSDRDFTYDDLLPGEMDANLSKFSIDAEKKDLLPILKKILAINPNIKILGSPWTAPIWMKVNATGYNGFKGGSLNKTYYDAYAKYFVKYIQAMKAEGITIDAVTPQNEPLNPNNNPSMVMEAKEEANFVKNHLGPQFKAARLATKIIVWDHNADRPDYPLTILKDPAANPFVDGSGFHLYGGTIDALTKVHKAFPDKNLYFTEQWVGGPSKFAEDLSYYISTIIVGAPRNWSRNVILWNLATNPAYGPFNEGGCGTCEGALTINGSSVSRNVSYFIIAHAAKFVRPGAIRIASDDNDSLPNIAFKNADGTMVLIVLNKTTDRQAFNIKINGKSAPAILDAGAVATYVWK